MTRRSFIKKGALFVPAFGILVPRVEAARRWIPKIAAAGGGGDNIAFRNRSSSTAEGTANGFTPTEPASAALNDVFIALAFCSTTSTSLGIPTGWTSLASGVATSSYRYNLAWIRRGSSAPSLTWTMSTSAYRGVHLLAYSGCITTGNPYEAFTDGGVTANDSTSLNPPSVTTLSANSWVICGGVDWSGANTTWTAPTGYTKRSEDVSSSQYDGVLADKKIVTAAAEDPAAFSGRIAASAIKWAFSLALKSS
jgi:hypothetical protein